MVKEDYAATGGTLKLKGVASGGIKKKKKKKSTAAASSSAPKSEPVNTEPEASIPHEKQPSVAPEEGDDDPYAGKTEAERRFERRRRQMMEKRLAKEGVKSHKERVEEYNKYLASLSEHHDMPRIGPG